MFLNLERRENEKIAAIDDSGGKLTFGQLIQDCRDISEDIEERELIFCLCENSCDALAGYISFYENKDVSLLLPAAMDSELLINLTNLYKPAYLWMPKALADRYSYEAVQVYNGYVLMKTGNVSCPMAEELSMLLMTSGSTGSPKLVRHRYGNLESNARNVAKIFGWTQNERAICSLPMQYTMGLSVINSNLYAGAALLLTKSDMLNPAFWSFIKENKGSSFTGVPYSYEILLKLRFFDMDLEHLKTLAQGGGRLAKEHFEKISDYAYKSEKRFFATYGTAETSARAAYLAPELAASKCCSIGSAIPEGELSLIDEAGREITKKCAEGELVYRGPNVTLGYAFCADDLLLGDDFNGVYHTGDIASRDESGNYYITGRKKRFIKLYGLRVNLDQCEHLIKTEFGIDCACVGNDVQMDIYISDKDYEKRVKSYLSEKTGFREADFKIKIVKNIPRNESGKVLYQELK